MKAYRNMLFFAIIIAAIAVVLKFVEYQFWVRSISLEVYLGLIALLFAGLGLWVGQKWLNPKTETAISAEDSEKLIQQLEKTGISSREYEVLQLLAEGLSNQEIADRLHVSLSTIKTHVSNLFSKLQVKRRTQAVQQAKSLHLLPYQDPTKV